MKLLLKDQVESILRNIPETRNSDIALTIAIWERFCPQILKKARNGESVIYTKSLFELPREDNIKRIRAKLNSEGKYYPTDWRVAEQRGIEENKWREHMGYPAKEETRNPTRQESYMDQEKEFNQSQLAL